MFRRTIIFGIVVLLALVVGGCVWYERQYWDQLVCHLTQFASIQAVKQCDMSDQGNSFQKDDSTESGTATSAFVCPEAAPVTSFQDKSEEIAREGFHSYENKDAHFRINIPTYARIINTSPESTEFDMVQGRDISIRIQVSARSRNAEECSMDDVLVTKVKQDYFLKTVQEVSPDWFSLALAEKENYQGVTIGGLPALQRISKRSSDGTFLYELETVILGKDFVYTVVTLQASPVGIRINSNEESLYEMILNSFRIVP